jgi:hypothetical protein
MPGNLSILIVHLTRENTTYTPYFKMQVSSNRTPGRRCHQNHHVSTITIMIGALVCLVSSYSSSSDFDGVCRETQESNRRLFFFVSASEEE